MDNVTPIGTAFAQEQQASQFAWPATAAEITAQHCLDGVKWMVASAKGGNAPENSPALSHILFTLLYSGGVFKDVADYLRTKLHEGTLDAHQHQFIQTGLEQALTCVHNEIMPKTDEESLRAKFGNAYLGGAISNLASLYSEFLAVNQGHTPEAPKPIAAAV